MARNYTAYYAFGGGTLDGETLQNTLGTQTNNPIQNVNYAATGGGVYTMPQGQGVMLGVEGQAIIDQDADSAYDTAIGFGYGLLNTGYGFKLGAFRLYPMIGIGSGGISFDVSEHQMGMPDFNLRASRSNLLIHLGFGIELRLGGWVGITVGLRTGYIFAPFSRREGIRGPYFRFMVGGSGRG